jgi:type IV pilus assembly protein PilN
MIRINLHPVRQIKKVQEGRRQLIIFVVFIAVEVLAMMLIYSQKSGAIDETTQRISLLKVKVEELKKRVGDFDRLKAQRERLIAQRNIINTLQKGRTGPVSMMRELSDILTKGKGPTVDQTKYEILLKRDPNAGFDPKWNPSRLWIERFSERSGNVTIVGKAKDHDDVAEFSKRLNLSKYFANSNIMRGDLIKDFKLGMKVVRFSLRCQVTF